ncbi:hypothetical protein CR205_16165 [Alteribacter lacisalsi]|uniref:Gamma-glutamyltransferase n=1 Tax=Alteribacter lacisalsi TaxID=2045244 RepID=A0A2W0HGA3_9BACI|nr:gamma-glutamyltransferase [Alteribacter lacisalsi]PYZ95912.1 hypothetical protein CR205_16165 [Alteribacter lacisalsi]
MKRRQKKLLSSALAGVMVAGTLVFPGSGYADFMKDQEDSVTGYGGAAATEDPQASAAAMHILEQGGNAVDAAIAAAAAQGVTRPFSGGIGGGGMMLVYLAEEDEYISIDNRSQATQAFGPDVLINPDTGLVYPEAVRITNGMVTSVPGAVKAWEEALENYGTMTMAEVLEPAREIAEDGFQVDSNFVRELTSNSARFALFEPTKELYFDEDGNLPEAGDIFTNPDLAETYRLIGEHGASILYEGEIAEDIIDTVNNPPVVDDPDFSAMSSLWEEEFGVLPGEMTLDDLSNYEALTSEPVHTTYRDYDVYGAPPSSSGGATIGQTLNMLEHYALSDMPRVQALHYYLEATRLSFADRREYIGDPAFTDIPVTGLTSKGFAEERRWQIDDNLADVGQVAPGNPWPYEEDPDRWPEEPPADGPALQYDFEGEDGDLWALDKFHRLDTGPTSSPFDSEITLQDNTGQMLVNARHPDRGSAYGRATATMDAIQNAELTTRFKTDNVGQNQRLRFWLQADVWRSGSSLPVNGYGVEVNLNTNELILYTSVNSTLRTLDTADLDMDTDWKDLRFRVEGNVLKASLWNADEDEPDEWMFDYTLADNDIIADPRGRFLLSAINFTQLNDVTFNLDNVLVEDLGEVEYSDAQGTPGKPVSSPDSSQAEEDAEVIHFEKEHLELMEKEELYMDEEEMGADESTIHLSVSDRDGNVVSYTSTIVSIGGNGMVVPDRGFLLNNALYGRIPVQPPNHPNYPRPGMRSMSSMSPTLVMEDGNPVLTLGAPGSDTILTTVLQVMLNNLEFGMPINEAIAEPRINQRNNFNGLAEYEQIFWEDNEELQETVGALEGMGHRFQAVTATQGIGAVTAIEFLEDGKVRPAAEPTRRGGGSAMVQSMEPLPTVERIFGDHRIATAVEISREGWNDGANHVVLARSDSFSDALAGSPLAHQYDAPVLLTNPNQLHEETFDEIERLGADTITILGGENAISPAVEQELADAGYNTDRIAGENRFDTSVEIAERVMDLGGSEFDQVVVANGQNFPDALSVAPYAALNGSPILLTRTDRLSDGVGEYAGEFNRTLVVGGEAAVSSEVKAQLPAPERAAGENRYETAVEVVNYFNIPSAKAYMATGSNFADALSGSALAAKNSAPIMLVRTNEVPDQVLELIDQRNTLNFYILGGPDAISETVRQQLLQ